MEFPVFPRPDDELIKLFHKLILNYDKLPMM